MIVISIAKGEFAFSLYDLLVYIVPFDGDCRHHRVVLLHCCVWFPSTITHTPLSSRKYQSALCSSLVSSKIYILWLLLLATTESTYTEPCLVLGAVGSLDAQHILARTSNTASNTHLIISNKKCYFLLDNMQIDQIIIFVHWHTHPPLERKSLVHWHGKQPIVVMWYTHLLLLKQPRYICIYMQLTPSRFFSIVYI